MTSSKLHPLTFAQESIYFLNDLTNGRPVYHMPQAFRLRGKLDRAALEKAVNLVVDRHEALRTSIVETPDGPRQTAQPGQVALLMHGIPETELPARLEESIAQPFDLKKGETFRADLFCLRDDDHVLLLNLHHALGDMSSLGVLFGDLSAAYSGRVLSPNHVTQIGAYAASRRAAEPAGETCEFWRNSLRDYTADLDLPLDQPRPRPPQLRRWGHLSRVPGGPYAIAENARPRSALQSLHGLPRCTAGADPALHRPKQILRGDPPSAIATILLWRTPSVI